MDYRILPISADLPPSPQPVLLVREEFNSPQPKLDRETGKGMTTVVGRIRNNPEGNLRIVMLNHNTIRGTAGGSVYNAELMVREGYFG
jgi:aspartate-semialdehyde dehydrogenase